MSDGGRRRRLGVLTLAACAVLAVVAVAVSHLGGSARHGSTSSAAGGVGTSIVTSTEVPSSATTDAAGSTAFPWTALPVAADLDGLGIGAGWQAADRTYGASTPSSCSTGQGDLEGWTRGFAVAGSSASVKLSVIDRGTPTAATAALDERRSLTYQQCLRERETANAERAGGDASQATWGALVPGAGGVAYRFTIPEDGGTCTRDHDTYYEAHGRYLVYLDVGACATPDLAAERALLGRTLAKLGS